MPIVDFIVPTKDVAPYLHRLVDSLTAQTVQDFRVIFVDDGSTDETRAICAALAARAPERYLTMQSTGNGPARARNEGLLVAQSPYVGFIDADDSVHPQYVERLTAPLESAPDIVESLFCAVDEKGRVLSRSNMAIYLDTQNRLQQLATGKISMVAWGKVYRREFVLNHAIKFYEAVHNGEDHVFTLKAYREAQSVICTGAYLYFWCRRANSLTKRKIDIRMIDDLLRVSHRKILVLRAIRHAKTKYMLFSKIFTDVASLRESILADKSMPEKTLKYLDHEVNKFVALHVKLITRLAAERPELMARLGNITVPADIPAKGKSAAVAEKISA